MSAAEPARENDEADGGAPGGEDAERRHESEVGGGAPPRHLDLTTAMLDRYARSWIDLQQTRKALAQRDLPDEIVSEFARLETMVSRLLTKTIRQHDLWPWLSQFPGLGGAHTALVIGRIGDPRRYPGQRCSEGHYLPPLYAAGAPCPIADTRREIEIPFGDGADESAEQPAAIDARAGGHPAADDRPGESDLDGVCCGVMLPPRTTTGVRSLWHWGGLHALDNGRAPRKTKGQRATWEPRARASVMQPGGIAEQIVRHGIRKHPDGTRYARHRFAQRYLDAYDTLHLRVADNRLAIEAGAVDAEPLRPADDRAESGPPPGRPLRPFEADRIARKIAAKAFLGDLLTEWKRIT